MKFIKDVFLNLISNFLLLFVLQILLYPSFGETLPSVSFGLFLTIIGIVNLFAISYSSAYINLYMKYFDQYKNSRTEDNYFLSYLIDLIKKFIFTSLLLFVIYYLFIDNVLLAVVVILFTIIMGIRMFSIVMFRVNLEYGKILLYNFILGLGYFILLLLNLNNLMSIFILMILVEMLVVLLIFLGFKIKLKLNSIPKFNKNRDLFNLIFMSLSSSASGYLDRIAINILFGATFVPIFYAATLTLKLFSQPLNVLSTVIFSYIAGMKITSHKIKTQILIGLPIFTLLTFLLGLFVGPYFINLIYGQFFEQSMQIYIPVNLALSLSVPVYILRSFIIKFYDTKIKMYIELSALFIYIVSILTFYIITPQLVILAYALIISLSFKNIIQIYLFIKIKF